MKHKVDEESQQALDLVRVLTEKRLDIGGCC